MIYSDDNIHTALEKVAKIDPWLLGLGALGLGTVYATKSKKYRDRDNERKERQDIRRNQEADRRHKELMAAMMKSKTANVNMVRMYLRQGLSPAAAVRRAYPGWSAARRAALVRRLRG